MANFTVIEPMSAGDVIDRSVRLYRRNFAPLITIVAVPTLFGYLSSLMFWFGLLEMEGDASSGSYAIGLVMLLLGGLGYPLSMFILLVTFSGLSRVIGDHLMLNETITLRKCLSAVRRRLGDITLMGLLSIAILVALYIAFSIILFVLLMIVGVVAGITATLGLPPWMMSVVMVVIVLVAVSLGIIGMLLVISRVIFLPQVVMIEGQGAGNALGRAMQLGKGNWYKVGAIVLFSYFVSISLLAALTLPVLFALNLMDMVTTEFIFGPIWNVIYTAFNQLTNLLVLPIWVVSFTMLYFDSRVRKEAYDIELLAQEVAPGFYWQPTVQQAAFGYQMPVVAGTGRAYIQTSPLGLAGYRPPPAPPPVVAQPAGSGEEDLRQKFDRAAAALDPPGDNIPTSPTDSQTGQVGCRKCGMMLEPDAGFCTRCGSPASTRAAEDQEREDA